jgi:hypothetical protein
MRAILSEDMWDTVRLLPCDTTLIVVELIPRVGVVLVKRGFIG